MVSNAHPFAQPAIAAPLTSRAQACTHTHTCSSKAPEARRLCTELTVLGSPCLWNAPPSKFPGCPNSVSLCPPQVPSAVHLICPGSLNTTVRDSSEIQWTPGLERVLHWRGKWPMTAIFISIFLRPLCPLCQGVTRTSSFPQVSGFIPF